MMYEYKGYKYRLRLAQPSSSYLSADLCIAITTRRKKWLLFGEVIEKTKWKFDYLGHFPKSELGDSPEEQIVNAHKRTHDHIEEKIKRRSDEERLVALLEEPKLEFMGRVMK